MTSSHRPETKKPRHHQPSNDEDFGILEQETMIFDLPPEIISIILLRLSVETLWILKCVSRYFSRFISSTEFIRKHLKLSTEDASMSSYKVMIEAPTEYKLRQTSIRSLCFESPVNFVDLDYPKKELEVESILLVGSCNGLVVIIMNQKRMFLWNPTIRKHKELPTIIGHRILDDGIMILPLVYCGFGFDASNDDYKVVTLFELKSPDSMSKWDRCYEVNVYSLKRDSWIRIPDFTVEQLYCYPGKFASGNIHWSTRNGAIVSFDVEKEVFGTLEQRNYNESCFGPDLCVLGGFIAVFCYSDTHVDVWVMKEYGIKESWTKMFTIPDEDDDVLPQPCSIMPNGEVLMDYRCFSFYNPKDDSRRFTDIRFNYGPVIYVKSLVSPCCN